MKRALCLAFCLSLLCFLSVSAAADTAEEMPEGYREFLADLPDDLAKTLPQGLFSESPAQVAKALSEFGNFTSILSFAKEVFARTLGGAAKLLWTLFGILILSRLLNEVGGAFLPAGGIREAFGFLKKLLLLSLLLGFGYESVSNVTSYLTTLANLTRASLPLLATLYATGGNVSAAVASSASLSVSLVLTERLVGKSILPLSALCLGFSLVELLTPFSTKSISDALKKNYTTFLSFLMVILLALLGGQTTLGAKADSLSAKSAKFAAGSLIPVAGGSISELLLSVGAGVSYLRSVCGVAGILLLLLTLFPPVLTLLCHRLLWQVAEGAADLFGCPEEKRLFSEFASLCGFLVATLLICSSALLLSFALVAGCAAAWR